MMKRWMPDLHSLSAQMILSLAALVVLMAAAAGVPAAWLIRAQLEQQAWAQVEQGSFAAQALYQATEKQLAALATLTAQRPTLHDLVAAGEEDALVEYLTTLQQGSGLDLALVCNAGQVVARAELGGSGIQDEDVLQGLCAEGGPNDSRVVPVGKKPDVWLLSTQPLGGNALGDGSQVPGTVTVGMALDNQFATQMRFQTGLEHTLIVDGRPVSTSLPARGAVRSTALVEVPQRTLDLSGDPYYAAWFPLGQGGVEAEVALPVANIAVTQRRLVWTLVGSLLVVAVIASILGTLLARRIGRPLDHLVRAADSMRKGDLEHPLTVEARVREVALVAQALEGARLDLRQLLAELRQEKAWIEHLLEAIVEGIVTLDRRGRITFFSHGAERITGWQRDQVLGQSCDHIIKPVDTDQLFSQLMPPPGGHRTVPVELPDGRQAILAVTGAQLLPPEGGDARVALVFRDVSEEEAMHRLLGHFLADVAHEFRTPLSALAASVELLLDQAPDLTPAELGELLTSLHLGVLGLQTLIDNLLEGASIEAGHFRVKARASSLGEIIAQASGWVQPLLDKRNQCLAVELPATLPVVQADPRRTVQVLVNLLSNASKFGPDDTTIDVQATVEGQCVRVAVGDSGPGVPSEHRQELFRRFVHSRSGDERAQVGAGLGLSIVKAVVEAQGGQVGIKDRPEGGAVFWFTLPVTA
jgi:PAS domain S-box-containing protein